VNAIKQFFGFSEAAENEIPQGIAPSTPSAAANPSPASPSKTKGRNIPANASEIKIHSPQVYDDSIQLASYLRDQVPIIVNLSQLDESTGKRFIDFLCGTAYAINGHMAKLSEALYLFTPQSMIIVESEALSDFEQGMTQQATSHYQ